MTELQQGITFPRRMGNILTGERPARKFRVGLLPLVLLHIGLALLMNTVPQIATVHGLLIWGLGMWWAISRKPEGVAYVGAYMVGAEVLWRMTSSDPALPWEFGKYGTIALFVVALFRMRGTRIPLLPLLFILLLVPSMLITLTYYEPQIARDRIVFNLLGHFALAFGAWFFSNLTLTESQLRNLFIALILPISSLATLVLYTILTRTGPIVWQARSSFATSGGFGPNQVSSTLGLGLMVVWIMLMYFRFERVEQLVMAALGGWFFVHCLLTFSRGGIATAAVGAAAATLHTLADQKRRMQVIFLLVVSLFLINEVALPRLNELTGGTLSERFSDTSLTGRETVAQTDLDIFREHPVWGLGVGRTTDYRRQVLGLDISLTHTEYTRMLAEHGIMGIAALALLILMGWINYSREEHHISDRGIVLAAMVWAAVFVAHSALRLVAPSFLFAFAFTRFAHEQEGVRESRAALSRPIPAPGKATPPDERALA